MSVRADITAEDGFFIGEDKAFVFTIQTAVGGVQNITGWTIEWAMADVLSGSSDLTKTAALTDAANGVCTVSIPSGDTLALDPSIERWYRLRRTNAGARTELAYGTVDLQDVFVD